MDKSPEYIKMCGRAHEIQKQWVQRHGDVFAKEDGCIGYCIMIDGKKKPEKMKKGFGISECEGVIRLSKYTWLPRLDQLMELAQTPGRSFEGTTSIFFKWSKSAYDGGNRLPRALFTSLEKAWLAFVMEKHYGKKWNGNEWDTNYGFGFNARS
jgi:hypothetical protein